MSIIGTLPRRVGALLVAACLVAACGYTFDLEKRCAALDAKGKKLPPECEGVDWKPADILGTAGDSSGSTGGERGALDSTGDKSAGPSDGGGTEQAGSGTQSDAGSDPGSAAGGQRSTGGTGPGSAVSGGSSSGGRSDGGSAPSGGSSGGNSSGGAATGGGSSGGNSNGGAATGGGSSGGTGGTGPSVPSPCEAPSLKTYFCDDFEHGLGHWVRSGYDWNTTSEAARSGSQSLTDSPGHGYAVGDDVSITLLRQVDLTEAVKPVLEYWYTLDLDYDDDVYVYLSVNGGLSWTTLATESGTKQLGDWQRRLVDLSAYAGVPVLLRLRLDNHYGDALDLADGWHIDDLQVRELELPAEASAPFPAPLPEPDPLRGCADPTYQQYFCDDFEQGLGHWVRSGFDWDVSDEDARSGTYSLTESPGGNYAVYDDLLVIMAEPVDLTLATKPVLEYWYKVDLDYGDDIYVYVSTNGGLSWTTLSSSSGTSYAGNWQQMLVDLSAYAGVTVLLELRLDNTYGDALDLADGWMIDDFQIRELYPASTDVEALPPPLPEPDPLRGCAQPTHQQYFCDDFEQGLGHWERSGVDWNITQEDARSGAHSLTDSPGSNYAVSHDLEISLARPVDLTLATDPVLEYWYKMDLDYGDDIYVYLSTNGGLSWTTLSSSSGDYHEDNWQQRLIDLSGYAGVPVMLKLRLDNDYGDALDRADGWHIEDLQIRELYLPSTDAQPMPRPPAEPDPLRGCASPLHQQYFCDDFDQGLGAWVVLGGAWGLFTGDARSAAQSLSDSPSGDYAQGVDAIIETVEAVDLTQAENPVLEYWYKIDLDYGDDAYVYVSTNGGLGWTQLSSSTGTLSEVNWKRRLINLSSYAGVPVHLRLRLNDNYGAALDLADGWTLDDLQVRELY